MSDDYDFPMPGLGRRKTPEEMIAPKRNECMECARHYAGVGCNSEAEIACGCCFSQITPSERIAQLTRILVSVVETLKYVEQTIKNQDENTVVKDKVEEEEEEEDDYCGHEHTLPHVIDMTEVIDNCVVCGTTVRKGKIQWENEVMNDDE